MSPQIININASIWYEWIISVMMLILILLIEILLIVHAYRMCFVMYTDSCAWRLWIDVIHIFFQVAIYEKFYPSIWDTEIFIYAYKLRFIFNIHIAITPINVLLLRLASYIYVRASFLCALLFSYKYLSISIEYYFGHWPTRTFPCVINGSNDGVAFDASHGHRYQNWQFL